MEKSTNNDINRHSWWDETGALPVPMTNDYMFKAVCQEDNAALKSLICAILHKDEKEIRTAAVSNPIILGKAIDEKAYIVDAKVELIDDLLLDLKLQVLNDHDWPERLLQYLCRIDDPLQPGDKDSDSKAAMHVGILKYDRRAHRSLLESYLPKDKRHHQGDTDKSPIHILTLQKADRSGSEDVRYHTDVWAKYFMARTWEDLKLPAQKDKGVESAVTTAHRLWQEEAVKAGAIAREDFIRRQNTQKAEMEKAKISLLKEKLDIS